MSYELQIQISLALTNKKRIEKENYGGHLYQPRSLDKSKILTEFFKSNTDILRYPSVI